MLRQAAGRESAGGRGGGSRTPHRLGSHFTLLEIDETVHTYTALGSPASLETATNYPPLSLERRNHTVSWGTVRAGRKGLRARERGNQGRERLALRYVSILQPSLGPETLKHVIFLPFSAQVLYPFHPLAQGLAAGDRSKINKPSREAI